MRITYVRIVNYKCFRDSGKIVIDPHLTVLVGQNNAGKTAFLESLKPTASLNKPHQEPNPSNTPFPRLTNPTSVVEFGIVISGEELKWIILSAGKSLAMNVTASDGQAVKKGFEQLFSSAELLFTLSFQSPGTWHISGGPFPERIGLPQSNFRLRLTPSHDKQNVELETYAVGGEVDPQTVLQPYLLNSIYIFRAERQNADVSPIVHTTELSTDAANLASALLQMDARVQAELTAYVRTIFPSIFEVRSRPIEGNRAQIMVTNRMGGKSDFQPGISVPLSDSGSGVGQVGAALCGINFTFLESASH